LRDLSNNSSSEAMRSANDRNTRRGTGNHSRAAAALEGGQNALPVGQRIGEFEIAKLIGEGGFGIVYLAYDHSLHRNVALKEYMPSGFASRTGKLQVAVSTAHYAEAFEAGLRSFVNEARMLAQFDSPSLVKVYRFWEANGTAYMVMPYYEGVTLRQAVKEHKITPTEQWVREFLAGIFDAIETIHRVQCFHRDIAPDNILLLKDGRPLLLDFGAARRVIEDLTHSPTAILKPGFAPIEQYAKISGMRQGAWTDVYALAAVLYFLITGARPPPAVMRMLDDDMVPAQEAGKGRYSPAFLAMIDKALAVRPEQRIQSVAELRRALAESDTQAPASTTSRQATAQHDDPEKTRVNTLAGSRPKTGTQINPSAAATMDARQQHPAPDYRAGGPKESAYAAGNHEA
jgi:serine/threonine protein kinase